MERFRDAIVGDVGVDGEGAEGKKVAGREG